jgi:AcrR family transcriptional regulator
MKCVRITHLQSAPCDIGPASGGIRQKTKALRPGQILEAAFAAFIENGYAGTRMEDIARRAGVSKGTLYVYFQTKADLFRAMAHSFTDPLMKGGIAFDPAEDPCPVDLLRRFLQRGYELIVDNPRAIEFFRLMITEAGRVPEIAAFFADEMNGECQENLRDIIRYGIARGDFAPDSVERLILYEDILFSPTISVSIDKMVLPAGPLKYELAHWKALHLDMVLGVLRPSAWLQQPRDHQSPGTA